MNDSMNANYHFRETYPHLRHAPGIVVAAVEQPQRLPDNCLVLPYDLR